MAFQRAACACAGFALCGVALTGAASRFPLVGIRLNNDRLELGYLNGMHPRGVLLSALTAEPSRSPSRLRGAMELRGVRFKPPVGHTLSPMTLSVKLQRVVAPEPAPTSQGT